MKLPEINEFQQYFNDPVWYAGAAEICRLHNLILPNVRRAEHGENIVFLIDDAYVLKIYTPHKDGYKRETAALEFCSGKTAIKVPELLDHGRFDAFDYALTSQIKGRLVTRTEWLTLAQSQQMSLVSGLADHLRQLHSLDAAGFNFDWPAFLENQAASVIDRQKAEGGNPEWFESLPNYLEENLKLLNGLPDGTFVHGDIHFGNLRIADGPTVAGIFDFADSLKGISEYEFVALGVLMLQGQGSLQREFFRSYGYQDADINEELRRRLMLLTILYEHSSLSRYAARLGAGADRLSLLELEKAIWSFA